MTTNVKVGDVVQLNSGGPAMTVTEVKTEYVYVQWFTDTSEPKLCGDSLYHGTYKTVTF